MNKKNGNVLNDAEITAAIGECLQGNNEAFAKIIHSFQAAVYNICFHFTGTSQDAEDAAAEVFIKTYHSLRSFNTQYKFSTWIFKITVNHCIGIARKKKREQNYLVSRFPDQKAEQADKETPAALFFRELEKEKVREVLRSIPLKYQAALMLKYYHDLSYQQISEILEVPKNTAASFILRGKKELRRKLINLKDSEV